MVNMGGRAYSAALPTCGATIAVRGDDAMQDGVLWQETTGTGAK
jgi:hypothetical protein